MADTTNQLPPSNSAGLHAWHFAEFPHYHGRDQQWYVWGAVIVAALLIFSVVTKNFLFAIIIIVASLVVLLFERRTSDVSFLINDQGIRVNDRFYPYIEIKNFYIIYQPPEVKTLYFELKSIVQPRIPVSLEDQDPVAIRHTLRRFIEEDVAREHEPTSDQFSRMFKL